MYYSSGNFEAYASPVKLDTTGYRAAYIIGGGLAGLSTAFFLVRDARFPGEKIHILEKNPLPGGACDGYEIPESGYVSRGDRSLDVHAECLWDMLRSVPSSAESGQSVLGELYNLSKRDPNYAICPVTERGGQDARLGSEFGLTDQESAEVISLVLANESSLYGKKVSDFLSPGAMNSAFWMNWQCLFGFDGNSGAMEFRRSLLRELDQLDGIPDRSAFLYTAGNQYESIVLPIVHYLEKRGVSFEYEVRVTGVAFDTVTDKKIATRIDFLREGSEDCIDLTDRDLLFISPGGCVENTTMGSQNEPAAFFTEITAGSGWDLWKRIAEQHDSFGHPEVFCSAPELTNRMSATVTTRDMRIVSRIKKLCKRDTFSGKIVTGGPVICRDSGWLLSWNVGRQPQYIGQAPDRVTIWLGASYSDRPGNFINKSMRACTGREICAEWLYHIGVPSDEIEDLAEHGACTIPVMMPFLGTPLMPRSAGDRPRILPDGSVNFAFIGQFAETEDESARTTEYAVRTAMEAVYGLMNVDRAVPAVRTGARDLRTLFTAALRLRDGRPLSDMEMRFTDRRLLGAFLKRIEGTELDAMFKELDVF